MDMKPRARRIASDEAHAWARNSRLGNPLAKFVLCMLTLYVNGDGECFVGISQLAEDCELERKTVMARLAWLENVAKVIKRKRQWIDATGVRNGDRRGRPTTDLISLLIHSEEQNSIPPNNPVSGTPHVPQDHDLRSVSGTSRVPPDQVSGPLAVRLDGPLYPNLEEERKKEAAADTRAREPLISDEAFKLADEITSLVGLDPKHPPPAWCGAAMHVAKWLRERWDRELILVGVRTAMARRSTAPHSIRYFEPAIAEELARQQAPLPKAEISRTPEGRHAKPPERRSVTAVLREQFAEARQRERDNPNRGDHARLLPPG
jgi:hypothetical protein